MEVLNILRFWHFNVLFCVMPIRAPKIGVLTP